MQSHSFLVRYAKIILIVHVENMKSRSISLNTFIKIAIALGVFAFYFVFADPDPPQLILAPEDYSDAHISSILSKLAYRIKTQPFNLIATLIFLASIIHIFFANQIFQYAEKLKHNQESDLALFFSELLSFCGEVEVIFGLWAMPMLVAMSYFFDWGTVLDYLNGLQYTEPLFVVVIMIIASTYPIVTFATNKVIWLTHLGGGSIFVRWMTLLTVGPLMGSFITEPGAMTLTAMLLGRQFYELQPSRSLAYATLGLLFVNISVGGVLTDFAAPPVLMVAQKWNWDSLFMLSHFGYKAVLGIILANGLYAFSFRSEFRELQGKVEELPVEEGEEDETVPWWVTLSSIGFLIAVVAAGHYPVLFVWIFLIFLGFYQATARHQTPLKIKEAILIGFFLAGLVVHGGVQGWWVSPVLEGTHSGVLMAVAAALSAFVDNAGITYLTTLVPNFPPELKYSVVAGAVIGGGLTVIANAPNPVGQSILGKYFEHGISPLKLASAALFPTIIMLLIFYALP